MRAANDFVLLRLEDFHDKLFLAIRALAENEMAPYAKEVDENSCFPEEALEALNMRQPMSAVTNRQQPRMSRCPR